MSRPIRWLWCILVSVFSLLAAVAPSAAHAAVTYSKPSAGVRFMGHTRLIHSAPFKLPRTYLPGSRIVIHRPDGQAIIKTNDWAGYADVACGRCALRYVAADFPAPSINCAKVSAKSSNHYVSAWIGLDGVTDDTVEQVGVDGVCFKGTPVYYVWYEMYPENSHVFTISGFSPGDALSGSVYYDSHTHRWQLTLIDLTRDVGFETDQACPSGQKCRNADAEAITEDPGGAVPAGFYLGDFGATFFGHAKVTSRNGTHGTLAGSNSRHLWFSYGLRMYNGNHLMAYPGALAAGTAFSVFWVASS
jgi:hypothetical protein